MFLPCFFASSSAAAASCKYKDTDKDTTFSFFKMRSESTFKSEKVIDTPKVPTRVVTLETSPCLLQKTAGFLDLVSFVNLCTVSKSVRSNVILMTPMLKFSQTQREIRLGNAKASAICRTFGHCFSHIRLHKLRIDKSDALQEFLDNASNCRVLRFEYFSIFETWMSPIYPLRLQTLVLQSDNITIPSSAFRHLKLLTRLHTLKILANLNDTPMCIDDLTSFFATHSLQKLKIGTGALASLRQENVSRLLQSIRKIRKFSLTRTSSIVPSLAVFIEIGDLISNTPGLSSVSIQGLESFVTIESFMAMTPSRSLPKLKTLKLDKNYLSSLSDTNLVEKFIIKCPNLEYLNLATNAYTSISSLFLSALKKLERLKVFCFGNNDFAFLPSIFVDFLHCLPPSLEQVYLHGCGIENEGALKLFLDIENGKFKSLWSLGLNGNPISDRGAFGLALLLETNPRLADLGITFSGITDVGVKRIASSLKYCKRLRHIYLFNSGTKCANLISQDSLDFFKAYVPETAWSCFDLYFSRNVKEL